MVNNTIPIPILKYVEISSESLEHIHSEYPFYIFPRIALILKKSESNNFNPTKANYFGYNTDKLELYLNLFQKYKTGEIAAHDIESADIHISTEPPYPLNDINIEIGEIMTPQLPVIDEESAVNSEWKETSVNFEKSSSLELDFSDLDMDIMANDEPHIEIWDNAIFDQNNNPTTDTVDDAIELQTDIPSVNESNNSSKAERPPFEPIEVMFDLTENEDNLQDEIDESLSLEFNFEDNEAADDELAVKLGAEYQDEEDIEDEFSDYIEIPILSKELEPIPDKYLDILLDEQSVLGDLEIADKLAATDLIHSDNKLEKDEVQMEDKTFIADSMEDNPTRVDQNNTSNTSDTIDNTESLSSEIISEEIKDDKAEEESPLQIDNSQSNKNFTSWLASFSMNAGVKQESDEDHAEQEELDRLALTSSTAIDYSSTLEELKENRNLNKDEELDGVLNDSFFKNQVEVKKAHRKTPSEMRIQDEAQLCLQPIDIVSETLAKLHAQQGNKQKAMEIYQKLIDLIPEKSSFFALQIENLNK